MGLLDFERSLCGRHLVPPNKFKRVKTMYVKTKWMIDELKSYGYYWYTRSPWYIRIDFYNLIKI